ncbi:fructokinase [Pseudoduganella flava]|uniref:Fructokinase n=1 Tax=Pseudoduganella flava TaxID=871742 RepID=A0A562Q3H5_9BURK|nr:PfkB family carbohydrate kinase [Pseudoduganella flava]QGZ41320.1 fructokinase [Pseudoduganella flava]TWI51264.1 fructokinase [Pseudoduganella flava]
MTQHSQPIAIFGEALVDDFGASQVVGGAPFNVARHLAAFGAATLTITRIGADPFGATVRAQFERFGMPDAGLQVDPVRPTGRVLVEQQGGSHRFTILPDQAYDHIDAHLALTALAQGTPRMLYFGTLAQRGAVSRATLDSLLAATDAPRYLDLNLRDGQYTTEAVLESIRHADILKVNDEELAWLQAALGLPRSEEADACAALIAMFRLDSLVVTLGPRGALWQGADGTRLHAAAPAGVEIVDTVGAGDAFSAVFLLGERHGWPRAATLARANAFAAAICGVRGAVPADATFHAAWLRQWAE